MSRMMRLRSSADNALVAEHDQIEAGVDRIDHPIPIGRLVEEEAGGNGQIVGRRPAAMAA